MTDLINEVPPGFLQQSPLDSFTPLLSAELKPEGYVPAEIAITALPRFLWLIRAAARSSENALSWRNYRVGAAVLSYNFETPSMGIFVGANIKPDENGSLNFHAEQIALAKARLSGLNHVMAIAIWGDRNDEDANPNRLPTLLPCVRCKTMFQEAPEVKPETLILSSNTDLSVCQLYSEGELARYYGNPDAIRYPVSDVPIFSLDDEVDEESFKEILVYHFIPKILQLYPEWKRSRHIGEAK